MKPVIAIVGRPNVGKSTLFNRIVGRRKAIVENEPGVTRDRNYADVKWDGNLFTLIDTGGFEPVSKDRIFIQMREQCQLAMEEADVILFVMDGKEGLTHSDRDITDILRRLDKPVFYIINKIDSKKQEERVYEFYGLGIEQFYPLSAEHAIGIDKLMDDVIKVLPKYYEEQEDDTFARIAVIGRPNVGKSSLINRILGYKRLIVDEAPGTTRDAIDTPFQKDDRRYILIDTAGIRRKSRISLRLEKYSIVEALRTIDRSDVALLMMDSKEGVTDQDCHLGGLIHERGKGCIILMNKWDLMEKGTHTMAEYKSVIYSRLTHLSYAPILFISALTGKSVERVLDVVDRVVLEARKRIPTSKLNRSFQQWIKNHPPPLYKDRTVKLNYITQVSIAPPTFLIYSNIPEGIQSSYERYLINKIRENFGFEGVPIRLKYRRKRKE